MHHVKKQQLKAEPENKNAEERRKAEFEDQFASAKRKEAEERRKAEVERKQAEKSGTAPEVDGLIDADIIFAWSKILPKFFKPVGGGSGFAISKDGYFLTNHHVAMGEGCNYLAVSYNKLQGVGKTVVYSEELDLALLKVDAPTPYFAGFDLSELKPGEKLVAIGYPLSSLLGNTPTVSEGVLMNKAIKKLTLD